MEQAKIIDTLETYHVWALHMVKVAHSCLLGIQSHMVVSLVSFAILHNTSIFGINDKKTQERVKTQPRLLVAQIYTPSVPKYKSF